MNNSDDNTNRFVINFMDTAKSKMLENALHQIQADKENYMIHERSEFAEAE